MRRTDRLFELMLLFRSGHLWRGRELADRLEVSLRTIYRDIDTLAASGVPIEGERGVGYILRAPIFLPPLTLSMLELEALHLGMAVVEQAGDPDLAAAASRLQTKIDAVLPQDRTHPHTPMAHIAAYLRDVGSALQHLPALRGAVKQKRVVRIHYRRLDEVQSRRTVRPLHLEYWGKVWTCTCWCALREDFRVFRVDRIQDCAATGETFRDEPGKTLADYMQRFDCEGASRGTAPPG